MSEKQWSEAEVEHVAERAATCAFEHMFKRFGVDVNDQDQVNKFRDGVVFAHALRRHLGIVLGTVITALVLATLRYFGVV